MSSATPAEETARSRISSGIVSLFKEYYGRGPERAKTYIQDDLVVVIMRGGFTRVEQTLLEAGHGDAVIHQRVPCQEVMRERFSEIIESETGRSVVAFRSGSHQDADVLAELFVLGPSDPTSD